MTADPHPDPERTAAWEALWQGTGWRHFGEACAALITEDEARFVRRLRVEDDETWRGVAEETAVAWHTSWESNQGVGMFLCEAAALRLGEDPNAEPWN